jgi:protoporphyrinogen IX oxidase
MTTAMLWLKAFHIMAVIAWMAGLFYLPRLFVYHAGAAPGSELAETLKTMEQRLFTIIMTPAMAAVWLTGPLLAWLEGVYLDGWLIAKAALVLALTGFHHALDAWRKEFAAGRNARPARFYRMANEVPTLLMAAIVLLVVLKPF